ncbi:MAG: peptide-methionine (S)-S-oxide reductase MsrA, partial [Pseudomonas sp.]
ICRGDTNHAEVILIDYDETQISFEQLLDVFFTTHDPTTLNRQGNDIGTQYRSVIYCTSPEQLEQALASKQAYQAELSKAGFGEITTEIDQAPTVYFAEAYHQQYLAKNPEGYCGIGGTGVCLPPSLQGN